MAISKFTLENGLQVTGSSNFSGSVSSSGGFTGSLFGTASYGQDANLLDGLDSSVFALTGSTNYFQASQVVSGNLNVTASLTASSLTASDLNIDYIDFVPQPSATPPAQQIGRVFVDDLYNEVNTWTDVTGVKLLQGQQLVLRAKCTDMATFTKGTVVRINGGTGANATFVTASWENDTNSADTLGLLMNSGVTNDFAYIIINGYITDINTDGYTPGQTLYLSSSGNFTNVVPLYPYHEVRLGQVVRAHANVGSVFVRVQNGYELAELHDVYTGSLSPGDLLVYENSVNTQWTNKKQLTGSYGLTGSLTASVGLSGALGLFPTLTGSSISGTTAQYTTISGSNISGALIGTLNTISVINAGSNLTASNVGSIRTLALTSSITTGLTLLTSTTGNFTILSGTTTTGSTALFTTVSGTNISGTNLNYTTLNTTQMTSSGKILVDNGLRIGNGNSRIASDIGIGVEALNSTNANSNYNTAIGPYALRSNTSGTTNIGIGYNSLYSNIGGAHNVAIGLNSLYNNNAGVNIAIGTRAGYTSTTETNNLFIGYESGYFAQKEYNLFVGNLSGREINSANNVGLGYGALKVHKGTAGGNFALGYNSLSTIISGSENIGFGVDTLLGYTNASYNIAIGSRAMAPGGTNITGNYNTAIGYNSLGAMTNGDENLGIGYFSLLYLTTGSQNSGIGTSALKDLRTGSLNNSIGYRSLGFILTGSNNLAIGNNAGSAILTGSGNVIIGSAAGLNNTNNNIYIADGVGNLRMFVSGNGNVGVGTSTPSTQLDVHGTGSFFSIKFPAVQSASSDVNTLDDYEEGTWIPALSGATTTNFTYNTADTSGSYCKIGENISLNGQIKITSTGSSAGQLYISNLPFALPAGAINYYSLNVGYHANLSATVLAPMGYGALGSNVIVLVKNTVSTAQTMNVTDLTKDATIMFNINYNAS